MGILDSNHSSRCGIVKYYPTSLPMIISSAAVYYASGKQRITMFDMLFIRSTSSECLVTCTPAKLALPSANSGNEHAFERTYASPASAPRSFNAPS